MAIEYDLRENPSPDKNGEKKILHARVVPRGTMKTEKILEAISQMTGFSKGEMEGFMAEFTDHVLKALADGYKVELGKFGYVLPKLKARPVMDKTEIRSSSISIVDLNFQSSAWLRDHLKGTLVRAEHGFNKSQPIGEVYRLKILDEYLEKNPFITRSVYSQLTGLLKNKALKSLNEFVEQGVLIRKGKGNQQIYLRVPQPKVSGK